MNADNARLVAEAALRIAQHNDVDIATPSQTFLALAAEINKIADEYDGRPAEPRD